MVAEAAAHLALDFDLEGLAVQLVGPQVVEVGCTVKGDFEGFELAACLANHLGEVQGHAVLVVVVDDLGTCQGSQCADALAVGQLLNGGGVGGVHWFRW